MEQYRIKWASTAKTSETVQWMNDLAVHGWTLHSVIPTPDRGENKQNPFGVVMVKYVDD